MLNVFTVSFFGHRQVENYLCLEKQVEKILYELLSQKEYVEILVGRNGEFDQLISSTVRKIKKNYRNDNCCHTLVLPYITAQYRNNRISFEEYYDKIDIYENTQKSHFKAAIQNRNKKMVDTSDLIVFFIEREYGGAYQTYKYAIKQHKEIILIE